MRRVAMSVSFGLFLAILLNISAQQSASTTRRCRKNDQHNAVFGTKQPDDNTQQLLRSENIKVGPRQKKSTTYPFVYPEQGDIRGNITYIEASDRTADGKGGCVFLIEGGVGYDNVTLHFRTQKSLGMEFVVSIYGKPKQPS
ncbi:uncharacterized protein LOC106670300 [Cimex lectularius]|uniref:Salivary secreted protein n=2 Tax=Cimex lectularius TaxID=79782 RepID=A0A8I6S2L3_CIMLE|nr:uncharacterized protein LOC106670300 [Cimex lectularius]